MTLLRLSVLACFASTALFAHHTLYEYDGTKPVEYQATVQTLKWENTHVTFTAQVTGPNGDTTWTFVLASVRNLEARRWKAGDLKAGDVVTVSGYAARDGSPNVIARQVRRADGRVLESWDKPPAMWPEVTGPPGAQGQK